MLVLITRGIVCEQQGVVEAVHVSHGVLQALGAAAAAAYCHETCREEGEGGRGL